MFARSTTVTGAPENIDTGIAYVRDEVMPALVGMEGCIGMSMLVNRASGTCIATSSWGSEEEMLASADQVSGHRDRAVDLLGGEPQVEEWEIAVMHREHEAREGGWCRVTWLQTDPSEVDTSRDFFRDTVLPRLEETDGFCSASLMINRSNGMACGTMRFDSQAQLEATRDMAAGLRAERSRMGAGVFMAVEEMELVLAHLRAPELV